MQTNLINEILSLNDINFLFKVKIKMNVQYTKKINKIKLHPYHFYMGSCYFYPSPSSEIQMYMH